MEELLSRIKEYGHNLFSSIDTEKLQQLYGSYPELFIGIGVAVAYMVAASIFKRIMIGIFFLSLIVLVVLFVKTQYPEFNINSLGSW